MTKVPKCIHQINEWMDQNFLSLNPEKTEVTVFGPKNERAKISAHLNTMALKFLVCLLTILTTI